MIKNLSIIFLGFLLSVSASATAADESLTSEFDSLGGNKTLLEKAKALEPDINVTVIQKRFVSRTGRIEISPEISGTFGGDTYTRTQNMGLNLHYHINHRWSLGAKYNQSYNRLTPEGEALINASIEDYKKNPGSPGVAYPQIDYPTNEYMATINWYPIYGKINLLDRGVLHFDMYFLAGGGQVKMSSGNTSSSTAGAGIGMWFNQNFTSRLEVRYQGQKAMYLDGEKNLDLAIASVQMGWML
jgi:outer membrane beta-barrel protein